MKYLTALSQGIKIGYQDSEEDLSINFSNRNNLKTLHSEDCVYAVFVCFEESDAVDELKESANRIHRLYEKVQKETNTILLIPFAHLSARALSDNSLVAKYLYKLEGVLTNKGLKAKTVLPNNANVFLSDWLFFDKHETVRYGSSQSSLRRSLMALVRIFGISRVLKALSQLT